MASCFLYFLSYFFVAFSSTQILCISHNSRIFIAGNVKGILLLSALLIAIASANILSADMNKSPIKGLAVLV